MQLMTANLESHDFSLAFEPAKEFSKRCNVCKVRHVRIAVESFCSLEKQFAEEYKRKPTDRMGLRYRPGAVRDRP